VTSTSLSRARMAADGAMTSALRDAQRRRLIRSAKQPSGRREMTSGLLDAIRTALGRHNPRARGQSGLGQGRTAVQPGL